MKHIGYACSPFLIWCWSINPFMSLTRIITELWYQARNVQSCSKGGWHGFSQAMIFAVESTDRTESGRSLLQGGLPWKIGNRAQDFNPFGCTIGCGEAAGKPTAHAKAPLGETRSENLNIAGSRDKSSWRARSHDDCLPGPLVKITGPNVPQPQFGTTRYRVHRWPFSLGIFCSLTPQWSSPLLGGRAIFTNSCALKWCFLRPTEMFSSFFITNANEKSFSCLLAWKIISFFGSTCKRRSRRGASSAREDQVAEHQVQGKVK